MYYISKSPNEPNDKAVARSETIKALVKKHFSAATVGFEFWDAAASSRLLAHRPKIN
jgi:hypothetical protein